MHLGPNRCVRHIVCAHFAHHHPPEPFFETWIKLIYNIKHQLVFEKHEKRKKHVPWAQMMHLMSFGPILVVTAHPSLHCTFKYI